MLQCSIIKNWLCTCVCANEMEPSVQIETDVVHALYVQHTEDAFGKTIKPFPLFYAIEFHQFHQSLLAPSRRNCILDSMQFLPDCKEIKYLPHNILHFRFRCGIFSVCCLIHLVRTAWYKMYAESFTKKLSLYKQSSLKHRHIYLFDVVHITIVDNCESDFSSTYRWFVLAERPGLVTIRCHWYRLHDFETVALASTVVAAVVLVLFQSQPSWWYLMWTQ